MPSAHVTRVHETYRAFERGELARIPEFFAPEGFYRTSGVFVGMNDVYSGHGGIEEFRHAWTEARAAWLSASRSAT